jgi:hypothetical protein
MLYFLLEGVMSLLIVFDFGCGRPGFEPTTSTNLFNRFNKVFNFVLLLKIRSTCAKKTIINRFFVLVGYELLDCI